MTERRVYGHTKSGRPITDEDLEKLAADARPATRPTSYSPGATSAGVRRSATRRPASSRYGSILNSDVSYLSAQKLTAPLPRTWSAKHSAATSKPPERITPLGVVVNRPRVA